MKKLLTLSMIVVLFALVSTSMNAGSPRMILMEEFTNASCAPCAANNPAYLDYLGANSDVCIPVMYHTWWPGPTDPMYLYDRTMNENRTRLYGVDQKGVPWMVVTGKNDFFVGSLTEIGNDVDTYRGQTSPITIDMQVTKNGNSMNVSVNVASDDAISNAALHLVAVQYLYKDANAGNNGETEFYHVARKMFPDANGTSINISAGGSYDKNYTYQVPSPMTANDIHFVAFVQNKSTKEVYQAASSMKIIKTPITTEQEDQFLMTDPSSNVSGTVVVSNPYDKPYTVNLVHDKEQSFDLNNWSVSVNPTAVYVEAGGTATAEVTVRTGANAGFASIAITATPQENESKVVSSVTTVNVLNNNTKYAIYIGTNNWISILYQHYTELTEYGPESAVIPMMTGVFSEYPVSDFRLNVFTFDASHNGFLSTDGAIQYAIRGAIEAAMQKGNSVLVTSEVDAALAFGQGSADAQQFFRNQMGVNNSPGYYPLVQNNQLYTLDVNGVQGDPITSGMKMTINGDFSQTWPVYASYASVLESTNDAIPILTYATTGAEPAAVRLVKGNGKSVFFGFPIETLANQGYRSLLLRNTIKWLLESVQQTAPEIAVSKNELDFGSVVVGENKTMEVAISNEGDEDLIISNIYDWLDTDDVYTIVNLPSFPLTIDPGEEYVLKVKYAPKAPKTYSAGIDIESNDEDESTLSISLEGQAEPNSVPMGTTASGLFEMKVGPNPVVSEGTVTYTLNSLDAKFVEMYLINTAGARVAELLNTSVAPGTNVQQLNVNNLPSGSYFIIANIGNESVQVPVVITK